MQDTGRVIRESEANNLINFFSGECRRSNFSSKEKSTSARKRVAILWLSTLFEYRLFFKKESLMGEVMLICELLVVVSFATTEDVTGFIKLNMIVYEK